jgi:hypothetical protein
MPRAALLIRCTAPEAQAIRNEAKRTGCKGTPMSWMLSSRQSRSGTAYFQPQSPAVDADGIPRPTEAEAAVRTAMLLRYSVDESERIRDGCRAAPHVHQRICPTVSEDGMRIRATVVTTADQTMATRQ